MASNSIRHWQSSGDTIQNKKSNPNIIPADEIQGRIMIPFSIVIKRDIEYQIILEF